MKSIQRYPLFSFFVLAFVITWSLQLAGLFLASNQGMSISNEDNFLHFLDLVNGKLSSERFLAYGLFSLGAGPLLSAILITSIVEGKPGLKSLWQRSIHWKVDPKWYLIILGLPIGISAISLGIGALSAGGVIHLSPRLPWSQFFPFLLYMLVFTGITEEPGWRGFALPRLQSKYNAEKSSWILGIIWGVWHFPFIIYYNYGLGIFPLLFSLLGLTLGIVGWTIVNTWVYNNTKSVWMMILLHAWGNSVQSYLILSSNNYLAQSLYSILPWAIAIILLRVYGKEDLSHDPRPQIE